MPNVTHHKSTKAHPKPAKGAIDACVGYIVRELEVLKANNGRKTPYGALKKLVDDHLVMFPWLNVMMVKNYLCKLAVPKTMTSNLSDIETEVAFTMAGMSSLTTTERIQQPTHTIIVVASNSSTATEADPTSTKNSITAGAPSAEQIVNNGLGGHPKGTTAAYSVELNQKIVLIKEEAAEQYLQVRTNAKRRNKRAEKGALTLIIEQVRAKHSIPKQVKNSNGTVRS